MNFVALTHVRTKVWRRLLTGPMGKIYKMTMRMVADSPEKYKTTLNNARNTGFELGDKSY